MAKYRKKAIVVTATRAKQPQYITTLEGVSEAKVGDYVVTGVDNEQWVVKPEWFKGSYSHISGDSYQRKPQVLEAVQIDKPEVSKAPTGDIKGSPGDYRVTGTKGEHWYVKPDIFDKTYEIVKGYSHMHTLTHTQTHGLQKSIDQIGMEATVRYLPKGMKLHSCDIHGHFLAHYKDANPTCSLCTTHDHKAEGVTASEVEHYINLRDAPVLNIATLLGL